VKQNLARHLYVEVALATGSAVCLTATVVWPQWIEDITGLEPDGGDGSTEWGWSLAFCAATLVCIVAARRTLKRIRNSV
jgi:hypothetical protein